MRNYWGRIILFALLIFVVGWVVVSAGRKVKDGILTSKDITIPLGPFVGFKLDGAKVGSIRQIKFRRSQPELLAGIDVRVRLEDTAAFTRLQECKLSVNDAQHFDERTSFVCLASDSGYRSFGEVSISLNNSSNNRVLVTPLLLPESVVQDIQTHRRGARAGLADSIAAEVSSRVRVQSRLYADSIEADRLDRRSARYKAQADSLRSRAGIPQGGATPSTIPPAEGKPKPL